jgi:hypothetical protein
MATEIDGHLWHIKLQETVGNCSFHLGNWLPRQGLNRGFACCKPGLPEAHFFIYELEIINEDI